ncbi:SDR family NAD(P)-dependent oxidoreductase [Pusillimonas sp. ANT_WB101]|uniref:SDR family NAD(P)-dependent oxidoreductase n=1 Tax=Pusillimonas sp. ANT_WB101 TaxID=2597356 RepID=UPI0011EFB02D|nr:SDR family NAD(P)-dependent oxidoreductase [Pusillimonas sp. ANT_WB101]KAA0889318.1 SDR family oxidoreductase [Pusillimonas sp. ANT_WB101]
MGNRLKNKVAIITGAGSVGPGWGNGRAAAWRFAQEGAKVFAVDLNPSALESTVDLVRAEGGEITPFTADVTQASEVSKLVEACIATYGRVDILMNNVGGSHKGGPVDLSEQDWDKQIDFNLKSAFLMCKYVLPHMAEQQSGAIVNVSSTSGIRWTGSAQVAYASSKAGVIQLSRVVAIEYASLNIRCNAVIPGQLHTPMVETRLAGQRAGGDVEKLLQQRQARIPLPFMGDGRDTANAALFLASDEARFITGTELIVDGGMVARCS